MKNGYRPALIAAIGSVSMWLSAGVANAAPVDYNTLYVPDPNSPAVVTSTANPGLETRDWGTQLYDTLGVNGEVIGTFNTCTLHFHDVFGFDENGFKVTGVVNGTAPGVGSVFNTFDFHNGTRIIYSDLVNADGTDTVTNLNAGPFGMTEVPPEATPGILNGIKTLC